MKKLPLSFLSLGRADVEEPETKRLKMMAAAGFPIVAPTAPAMVYQVMPGMVPHPGMIVPGMGPPPMMGPLQPMQPRG